MTTTATGAPVVADEIVVAGEPGSGPSRFSPANLFRTYGALVAIGLLALVLLVWAPGSLNAFRLGNLGKYCCWAIAAVGIGLAWGRGGMLVMGQGVFFGLGGYMMAMHMKLEAAGPGAVPDFMVLYGDATMPSWWEPFRSGPFTLFAIVALPALVAFVIAAVMASVGGAMFVPIAGIISPSNVDATASIMLIAGVALGGRASLLGPALGAIAVGYGQTTLSEQFPTQWTYFQGGLFIVVLLLLPYGITSLLPKLKELVSRRAPSAEGAA
jgi:urea transport system permease protein